MIATKQKLLDGAIAAIREHGVAGVSARTIAATAGVNQALVFYHYGSVHELLAAAAGARNAFSALEQLAVLVEVAEDLGPVARRALRSRLAKARGPRASP